MRKRKKWKVNVVFHKYLVDKYYDCDPSFNHKYYDFVKCNEKYSIQYNDEFGYNVWSEDKLKYYDPYYQKNVYMAPSLIYHFFKNRLHEGYEYVGFVEYDIALKQKVPDGKMENGFTKMVNDIVQNNDEMIIPLRCQHRFKMLANQNFILRNKNVMETVVDDYNNFFGTLHAYSDIIYRDPLLTTQQSFILDSKTFGRIGRFLEHVFENRLAEGGTRGAHRPSTILDRYVSTALLLDETEKYEFNFLDHKSHKQW